MERRKRREATRTASDVMCRPCFNWSDVSRERALEGLTFFSGMGGMMFWNEGRTNKDEGREVGEGWVKSSLVVTSLLTLAQTC